MNDDEPPAAPDPGDAGVDRALAAWTALAPPADFADRVLAARGAPRRSRWPRRAAVVGGIAAAGAAAVVAAALWRAPHRAASGTLIARQRTSQALGDRGIAVAEPDSELTWRVDDRGAAELTQRAGDVFYRVERGEPFVVHTPAGDVRVTGTCFRIEVEPMNTTQKMLLSGVAGAAVAAAVLVTVYEGHVIAETRSARTELPAGSTAALGPGGEATIGGAVATPGDDGHDDGHATREQLLVRTRQQQAQLAQLRARLAAVETAAGRKPGGEAPDEAEPGRLWHDPSPERLAEWVAECRIRVDEPSLERWSPLTGPDAERGIAAGEVAGYNEAITEMRKRWKDLVRSLYLETTGDTAGADTLSTEAMRHEIEDKSPPGESQAIHQRLAQERAGQAAPPADLARTSALERLVRTWAQLGDQSEAALARRLGAPRAHAIRGDGWSSRSDQSGCPAPAGGH